MKAVILDDYQNVALSLGDWAGLGPRVAAESEAGYLDGEDATARRLADADIVVAMRERTPFPRTLIQRLPKLKLLVTSGMRNAAIDLAAAAERSVTVSGTDMLGYPTAELTWGLILALVRRLPWEMEALRAGRWQLQLGTGLSGKTLGIAGLGKLGTQVARIGKAFGMEAIAWSQNLTDARAAECGVRRVAKDELFRQADVLTVHLVLSQRTRGLVGTNEIGRMKIGAHLVNTSRGPIVDEAALIAALNEGRIAGAALDVYDREPLPTSSPLRSCPNLLLTPHLGYVTIENYRQVYAQAVENIRAFLDGKPIRVLSPRA